MKIISWAAVLLVFLAREEAFAQEYAVPGLVVSYDEAEEDIIVVGQRTFGELPLSYEPFVTPDPGHLNIDTTGGGEVFIFTRRVWEEDGVRLEYFRSWTAGEGFTGLTPEDRRSAGRLVFELPLFGRGRE